MSYFCDTALAAWLIGIHEEEQLATHPLRGALFENLVVMEFVKHAANRGEPAALWFFRDSAGTEVEHGRLFIEPLHEGEGVGVRATALRD